MVEREGARTLGGALTSQQQASLAGARSLLLFFFW